MFDSIKIRDLISGKGLKVTPQRMLVLKAICESEVHPTAENIINNIRKKNPNIGSGTVYNVLETLVENNLIKKVMTEKNVMRYDGIQENHHHLYCRECDYIEDYKSEKLDAILKEFFEKNKIDNFNIEDIQINIRGNFIKHKHLS